VQPHQYLIQPYCVGKHKRSLAMILPTGMVKALDINPQTVLLLLKVKGNDDIYIKIIRQEDLSEKNTENTIPADKVLQPSQQASAAICIKKEGSGEVD
jgi:antitoxin component of MazEF toxin-antitoxin module